VTIHTEQGELPAVFGYALGVRKAFGDRESVKNHRPYPPLL
jgi:hypothetical protein